MDFETYKLINDVSIPTGNEDDDRLFIIKFIVQNSLYLLKQTDLLLNESCPSLVYGILRQVYEYLYTFLGLGELNLPLDLFLTSPQEFRQRSYKEFKTKYKEHLERNIAYNISADDFLLTLKKVLDVHSHAGLEQLTTTYLDKEASNDLRQMLMADARIFYLTIENLFIASCKGYFKIEIAETSIDFQSLIRTSLLVDKRKYLDSKILKKINSFAPIKARSKKDKEDLTKFVAQIRAKSHK